MSPLLFAAVALAQSPSDPSSSCYTSAHDSAASITVEVNGSNVVGPTDDLAAVFGAVASTDQTDSVSLKYNSAGATSITDAMSCLLNNDTVTLGMMRVHQIDASLQVRTGGLIRVVHGRSVNTLNNVHMTGLTTSGTPIFVFGGEVGATSCLAVALEAYPALATGDWFFQGTSVEPLPGQICVGQNCSRCTYDTDGWGCGDCAGVGDPEGPKAWCQHISSTGGHNGGFVPSSGALLEYRY